MPGDRLPEAVRDRGRPQAAHLLRQAHRRRSPRRHPRRGLEGLHIQDHRRQRQAGLPDEAGRADQRSRPPPPLRRPLVLQAETRRRAAQEVGTRLHRRQQPQRPLPHHRQEGGEGDRRTDGHQRAEAAGAEACQQDPEAVQPDEAGRRASVRGEASAAAQGGQAEGALQGAEGAASDHAGGAAAQATPAGVEEEAVPGPQGEVQRVQEAAGATAQGVQAEEAGDEEAPVGQLEGEQEQRGELNLDIFF